MAELLRLLDLAESMSGVGRWRYDVTTGVIKWSPEVYRIHGVTPQTFTPDYNSVATFYQREHQAELRDMVARALETGVGYDFQFRFLRRDGAPREVLCKAACEVGPQGGVTALFGVFQDITEQVEALRNAREQTRRARMAERLAGLGHWRLEMSTRAVTWSESMYDVYGLEAGSPLDLEALMAMTHPDDAAAGAERLRAAIRGEPVTERTLTRIRSADGGLRYLAGSMDVERGKDGAVVAVIGTLMDITDVKQSEVRAAESEARYRLLAESAQDLVMHSDMDGRLTYISPSVLPKTGFAPEDLVGGLALAMIHPEDIGPIQDAVMSQIASRGAETPRRVEYRACCKDGSELWLEARPTVAIDPRTGRMTGVTDIVRDISERKALELDLRAARAEAEASASVKTEFLAKMSHELRTPLTSVLGFTRLAATQPELSDLTRGYIQRVENASQALLSTVNDILDFSKLEAGQVAIRPEPTSVAALCRSTLELFAPQAGAKDLDLVLSADAEEAVVMIDPDRIRQILLNLVGNAVKFTDQGSVTLHVTYNADARLKVSVDDTGAGIPADKLNLLFQRFSQIDGSLTRSGGTGLGLAICKGLVEAMGGKIGADSAAGAGSRFWFEIPAEACEPDALSAAAAAPEQLLFAGVRVLVVDDHPANRELARLFLVGSGAEVSEATDGQEGVDAAARLPFDAILMDVRMPRLDGPGALRRIRTCPGPNDATPILAFTADASADEAARLRALGFDGVVAKPVEPAALIAALAEVTAFDVSQAGEIAHVR